MPLIVNSTSLSSTLFFTHAKKLFNKLSCVLRDCWSSCTLELHVTSFATAADMGIYA